MQYKRILSIGLSLVLAISSAACGAATGASTSGEQPAEETAGAAEGEETADAAGGEAEAAPAAGAEDAAPAAGSEEAAPAAAAQSAEIPASDISVKWDDSRVYGGTSLGSYDVITTYEVKGYEDVPFIKASDYLRNLCEGKEKVTMQDGVMKLDYNNTVATIDPAADTIVMENPCQLRANAVVKGAIVDPMEYSTVIPSVKNQSSETAIAPVTISLANYNMPVIAYEDDILMPFLALQNTFGNIMANVCLVYNGKDYFNVAKASSYAGDNHPEAKESPYFKAIYSGPFSTMDKTTQAYADYGYNSICLLLDLTFGHKEEKNITSFDEYFTRINAKGLLCSTDPTQAVTAEVLLFNYLFDSGHDSMISFDTVFGNVQPNEETVDQITDEIKESEEGSELFGEGQDTEGNEDLVNTILGALIEKGLKVPEIAPLMIWSFYMMGNAPKDYGNQRLDYSGDTAVIYFTSFMDDSTERNPSYYLAPVTEQDEEVSNFAFFYNCFEDIKQHDEVKNVVINIANNGGGAATGLVSILGFLSEDGEVHFTTKEMLTGSYRDEWYHVDTNLDGVADDEDGYGGQYDFYIMTSGSSYSCGNALPYYAQQDGLAKIIGANPGGGDCVVGTFIDAYGRTAAYSSTIKLGRETENGFVSDEKAIVLDYNMVPSVVDIKLAPWFDADGIAQAVHNYQNGETQAVYSEEEEAQVISELMEGLFERMAQQ